MDGLLNAQLSDIIAESHVIKVLREFSRQVGRMDVEALGNLPKVQRKVGVDLILDNFFQFSCPRRYFSGAGFLFKKPLVHIKQQVLDWVLCVLDVLEALRPCIQAFIYDHALAEKFIIIINVFGYASGNCP